MVSYQWIHTLFLAVLCYVLLLVVGPSKGRYAVFVVAFAYLSGLHIYRMMYVLFSFSEECICLLISVGMIIWVGSSMSLPK